MIQMMPNLWMTISATMFLMMILILSMTKKIKMNKKKMIFKKN